ncbi:OmpA family protein [bacterium]|nr:OmpA family protein [bacterium]
MAKSHVKLLFLAVLSLFLVNCATQQPTLKAFKAQDLNPKLKSGQYKQKVDNFLVILDASSSMANPYKGERKLNAAKAVVSRMNQTVPDLELNAAIERFGQGSFVSGSPYALIYGPTKHTKAGLDGALATIINANGDSPLNLAIDRGDEDLKQAQGGIAVIVVSDGSEIDSTGAENSAKKMKDHYGDALCIYTIQVGDDPQGKDLMERVARASECGFSVNADDIMSSEGMAGFVEKVFLAGAEPSDSDGDGVMDDKDQCPGTPRGAKVDARGCPLDTDGDGVLDGLDRCPNTPRGARVDAIGCPSDTDGDGVYDGLDQCPGTPKGVMVDARGCPRSPNDADGDGIVDAQDKCPDTPKGASVNKVGCWILEGVRFDTGKANIKPTFYPELNEVVTVLNRNPGLKVEIQGHTDNVGAAAFNQKLSERRAKSVMEHLVNQGIDPSRLSAKGYGSSRPAASNATPEGRAMNRRVELKPMY